MVFQYKKWDEFCKKLHDIGRISIPACEVTGANRAYIVLKHDVEASVPRALKLAEIEQKYGHRGSYYVQAYLMEDSGNIEILKKMQQMGHEISYHYDVMDSNKGNLNNAIQEFEEYKKLFEKNGFSITTVCQHGNPIVERIGYTSNRDFFRSVEVQERYPDISDIMVDFKEKHHTDYTYYSDAGRKFNLIYDPINNDIVNSNDKNTPYEDLEALLPALANRAIISTHPHRWTDSVVAYMVKEQAFKLVKITAKIAMKIPSVKRVMNRYYYLAKKI